MDKSGRVTRRHQGQLFHIGVGNRYAAPVSMLAKGCDVRILALDGAPLRHLYIDPTRNSQPIP